MPITSYRIVGSCLFFVPLEMQHFKGVSSYCVLDSFGQQRPRQDSEVQTVFASLLGSCIFLSLLQRESSDSSPLPARPSYCDAHVSLLCSDVAPA